MIKHPQDRASRRSAYAKALELRQFRQQVRHGKRKHIEEEIKQKEADDELVHYRHVDLSDEHGGTGWDRLDTSSYA